MPASPLPLSPNGLLEVGHSRITASTAVVNAVADALGTGDRPIQLPPTPARVRALVLGEAEGCDPSTSRRHLRPSRVS